jgi:hypothetical protein
VANFLPHASGSGKYAGAKQKIPFQEATFVKVQKIK